jgi:hypothetical protein
MGLWISRGRKLVEQRGQLVTREHIIERVWGRENDSTNFTKDSTKKPGKAPGESEKKAVAGRPTMFY